MNGLSFDVEDWFQAENLKQQICRDDWHKYELRVIKNTQRLLQILAANSTKATFFFLGWIAEKCPQLVREIDAAGHEVASHGYWHKLVYAQTQSEFREDVSSSKSILENITSKEVLGYRAPSFSISKECLWAFDVLKDCGFTYDSSIFPVSLHDRYGFPGIDSKILKFANGLIEIPVSTFRFCNINFPLGGGGYFRLFPYKYFRYLFGLKNRANRSVVFYLHPWELDDGQPRVSVPLFYKFRHYINLARTETKLISLLCDFHFQPMRDLINGH